MARIRTVKPELWASERFGECSTSARLMFIASLNFADDAGNLDRSSRQLKAQTLPYDNVKGEPLVQELIAAGLFIEYEVADRKYLHIKNFNVHQRIEKPSRGRIPSYEPSLNSVKRVEELVKTPPVILPEHSQTPPEKKPAEGKGMEGIKEGKGKEIPSLRSGITHVPPESAREQSEPRSETVFRPPRKPTTEPAWFADFRALYPRRAGSQNWDGALKASNARLKDGFTTDDFLAGARRYAAYAKACGSEGTQYVMQAATFLGPGHPFTEPWEKPASVADARLSKNLSAADDFMRRTS
jgi:hypothetical protein